MKTTRIIGTLALFLIASLPLFAQREAPLNHTARSYRVTVTNLTPGQGFSPAFIATHNDGYRLFTIGQPASPGLARIAEEGDPALAVTEANANNAVIATVVAGTAPFMPGQSVSALIDVRGSQAMISVAGMLGTTNDAFYAVNAHDLPNGLQPLVLYVPAYDAGSERNTEDCDHVPGPPCMAMGVRATDGAEGMVTVHGGIHGGVDLDPRRLDWRNPVARITIERETR